MLNAFFVLVVLASVLVAAYTGRMEALSGAIVASAGSAVTLALGLIGVMAFFLGLMRAASDAGLLKVVARLSAPVLRRLFPEVPADHPAMSAIVLNIASNMLGLGNAATPFGIKAIRELDSLNPVKGTATDAMVLFLAINTAGLALLPAGIVAMRAAAGSSDPAGILVTTWFASGCATIVAILAAVMLAKLPRYRRSAPRAASSPTLVPSTSTDSRPDVPENEAIAAELSPPRFGTALALLYIAAFALGLLIYVARETGSRPAGDIARTVVSFWVLPALVAGLVIFSWARGGRVYGSLVEGAKEGFQVALTIIPYLVAILVAIGMLRASGALDAIVQGLAPMTAAVGLPAEALPMALLRPLSGSGAYAVMSESMARHGPDSFIGYMVSTLQGSTETTFYILAVYFGAVGIKRTRHALPACLLADLAGMTAAVFIVNVMFR